MPDSCAALKVNAPQQAEIRSSPNGQIRILWLIQHCCFLLRIRKFYLVYLTKIILPAEHAWRVRELLAWQLLHVKPLKPRSGPAGKFPPVTGYCVDSLFCVAFLDEEVCCFTGE
ncbi:hypothetical protein [Paracoccus yeei]|uniref:hypothetical protein n=1 Tax=Paracoccus yeei TaxID=147645 RepID=UPI0011C41D7F|nr:hypothetical protein [Paracoccus yeei]